MSQIQTLQKSEADLFEMLPLEKKQAILNKFTDDELAALKYCWRFWARPNQMEPPGDWSDWFIMAGRSFGKTRAGAEWVRTLVDNNTAGRIALVARTPGDVRTTMIEGDSGLMNIFPPHQRPVYKPSLCKIIFYNGAVGYTFSSAEPNALRGPQHDAAWLDEPAAWYYPDETYDMLRMGLRLGKNPRACLTTTPRPIKLIKKLLYQTDVNGIILKDASGIPYLNHSTVVSHGTSWDNKNNIAAKWFEDLERMHAGTRLGRQELYAELLLDTPGALWTQETIDKCRYTPPFDGDKIIMPNFRIIVIGVDPAISDNNDSCETGIIVCGLGVDGYGYVIEDSTTKGTPTEWGNAVNKVYNRYMANRAVAEVNQGGDMVQYVLQTINPHLPVKKVHASRSKQARAEPVSALYEKGLIRHIGSHSKLEDQLCTWVPGEESPDRLDAMVWAFTDLFNLYDKKIETKPVITSRAVINSKVYY